MRAVIVRLVLGRVIERGGLAFVPTGGESVDDLAARGARVLSVFGPFNSRVLVEMPASLAEELFPDGLGNARRSLTIDAAERERERVRRLSAELADGPVAASAVAMAYEIDDPYNSATSKSMCAGRFHEALKELRALAPPEVKRDGVDEIQERRVARRAASADLSRP